MGGDLGLLVPHTVAVGVPQLHVAVAVTVGVDQCGVDAAVTVGVLQLDVGLTIAVLVDEDRVDLVVAVGVDADLVDAVVVVVVGDDRIAVAVTVEVDLVASLALVDGPGAGGRVGRGFAGCLVGTGRIRSLLLGCSVLLSGVLGGSLRRCVLLCVLLVGRRGTGTSIRGCTGVSGAGTGSGPCHSAGGLVRDVPLRLGRGSGSAGGVDDTVAVVVVLAVVGLAVTVGVVADRVDHTVAVVVGDPHVSGPVPVGVDLGDVDVAVVVGVADDGVQLAVVVGVRGTAVQLAVPVGVLQDLVDRAVAVGVDLDALCDTVAVAVGDLGLAVAVAVEVDPEGVGLAVTVGVDAAHHAALDLLAVDVQGEAVGRGALLCVLGVLVGVLAGHCCSFPLPPGSLSSGDGVQFLGCLT